MTGQVFQWDMYLVEKHDKTCVHARSLGIVADSYDAALSKFSQNLSRKRRSQKADQWWHWYVGGCQSRTYDGGLKPIYTKKQMHFVRHSPTCQVR